MKRITALRHKLAEGIRRSRDASGDRVEAQELGEGLADYSYGRLVPTSLVHDRANRRWCIQVEYRQRHPETYRWSEALAEVVLSVPDTPRPKAKELARTLRKMAIEEICAARESEPEPALADVPM
jgi:hypothetical protein